MCIRDSDKCAAGTGRFLEMMARTLGLSLEEMSTMGPVSYTHLDVYKRQIVENILAERGVIFAKTTAAPVTPPKVKLFGDLK